MELPSDSLSPSRPAAPAVPAVQPDRIQAAGDPQLQERQRRGEQQDEAGQAGPVQRDGSRPVCARGLLQCCVQTTGH